VTEALRPVRLGCRLQRSDERDLAPEGDLDVGPTGQFEDRPVGASGAAPAASIVAASGISGWDSAPVVSLA
jgi:hypothetical protein